MPAFKVVKRDYKNVYNQFISYGPLVRKNGLGAHGTRYSIEDEYDEYIRDAPHRDLGRQHLSVARSTTSMSATRSCTSRRSPTASWPIARTKNMEEKTGVPLVHLAEKNRGFRTTFKDIQSQPRRFINSPMWSGLIENGRTYSPFTYNVEANVPGER